MANQLSELADNLIRLVQAHSEMMEELVLLRNKFTRRKTGFLAAKTVFASYGGLGSCVALGGIALSPFTAGASLSVVGLGAATGALGGIYYGMADIMQKMLTNKQVQRLIDLNKCQTELIESVHKVLVQLNTVMDLLVKDGNSPEEAFLFLVDCLRNGKLTLEQLQAEPSLIRVAMSAAEREEKVKQDGLCKDLKKLTLSHGFKLLSLKTATALLDDAAVLALRQAGKQIVFKGIGIGVGAVFSAKDIITITKEWKADDPIVDYINEIIQDYKMQSAIALEYLEYLT